MSREALRPRNLNVNYLPPVVQHRPVIIPDVSSLTTEAPPAMLNLDDNYSSLDEAYIEPAGSITAGHSAKRRKKMLKY